MLVQVALIIFGLCGTLALVVDVGLMRLTQVQLQTAADSAAVEGLRKRDITIQNAAGQTVLDPYASDCLRRAAANRMVRWTFDDDFDVAGGSGSYQLGAGPVLQTDGGVTSVHALTSMTIPASPTYKPDLQMNQENVVYGDMVSGRFCYTEDPQPAEGGGYEVQDIVCTEPQRGSGTYARADFNPNDASPAPPNGLSECPGVDEELPNPWPTPGTGSLTTVDDSAFLVRLRRSNEFSDGISRGIPGVASSGPSLPLLYGGAANIANTDADAYSPRRDGLTVRATAIANARPAMQIGLPQGTTLGVTPFVLVDTYVGTLTTTAAVVTVDPTRGVMCAGTTCVAATPAIGRFVDALTDETRRRWAAVASVGATLTAASPLACAAIGARTGYVPVYSALTGGANRVIGFSRIAMTQDPARPADPCAKVLVRSASLVAPANASVALTGGIPTAATTTATEIRELFDKHQVATGRINYAPVLAPVLAR